MVNLDVNCILAVILVSCINGAPTDILWNKEDGSHTGTIGGLLKPPGDIDSSDSLAFDDGEEDSNYNDKRYSDLDFNLLDTRSRRFDPSAFAALRGKRDYSGPEVMDNDAILLSRSTRSQIRPSTFVAIRGKKSVPSLPISELQYQLLLRSILNAVESLANRRQGNKVMTKRQPPFRFHALRG